MPYAIAIITGYLLGCSNMAFYIAKARGVDMRAGGTGNLGTCNALLLMDWKAALLVCVHDIGKAALAVLLLARLFARAAFIGYVAGAACILGHIYPFYLGFKGGKGYASYLGMALALDWRFAIALALIAALVSLITNYTSIGAMSTAIAYPLLAGFGAADWRPALIVCAASALVLHKHRENCTRIMNGTEPRLRALREGGEEAA